MPAGARGRLVLENDVRWPLAPVLELARPLGVPVVFDAFHHELAPSLPGLGVRALVETAGATWRPHDGRQEMLLGYQVNDGQGYSHTYANRSDVTSVCVNFYDVHGGGTGTKL